MQWDGKELDTQFTPNVYSWTPNSEILAKALHYRNGINLRMSPVTIFRSQGGTSSILICTTQPSKWYMQNTTLLATTTEGSEGYCNTKTPRAHISSLPFLLEVALWDHQVRSVWQRRQRAWYEYGHINFHIQYIYYPQFDTLRTKDCKIFINADSEKKLISGKIYSDTDRK